MKLFAIKRSRTVIELSRTRKYLSHHTWILRRTTDGIISYIECVPTSNFKLKNSSVEIKATSPKYAKADQLFNDLRSYLVSTRNYPPRYLIDPFFDDGMEVHGRDMNLFELFKDQSQAYEEHPPEQITRAGKLLFTHFSRTATYFYTGIGRSTDIADPMEMGLSWELDTENLSCFFRVNPSGRWCDISFPNLCATPDFRLYLQRIRGDYLNCHIGVGFVFLDIRYLRRQLVHSLRSIGLVSQMENCIGHLERGAEVTRTKTCRIPRTSS